MWTFSPDPRRVIPRDNDPPVEDFDFESDHTHDYGDDDNEDDMH